MNISSASSSSTTNGTSFVMNTTSNSNTSAATATQKGVVDVDSNKWRITYVMPSGIPKSAIVDTDNYKLIATFNKMEIKERSKYGLDISLKPITLKQSQVVRKSKMIKLKFSEHENKLLYYNTARYKKSYERHTGRQSNKKSDQGGIVDSLYSIINISIQIFVKLLYSRKC